MSGVEKMSVSSQRKKDVISKYSLSSNDTGSAEVQIALLSDRINHLTEHFKDHLKDHQSRTGLLKLVGQRRKMLDYLKVSDHKRYRELISSLGLRK